MNGYETENYVNGAPAVVDGKAVFGGCDGVLHIVSVSDGKHIDEIEIGPYIAGTVAAAGTRAFVGHYEGGFLCADLADGEIVWEYGESEFPFFSSAAIGKDRVVFGGRDKRVHCVRRDNGKGLWTFRTRGQVDSSPVICGEKVVAPSADGRLYVLGLADGKELWSFELGEAVIGSPAVAAGKIVVGCEDGRVYAFGAKR